MEPEDRFWNTRFDGNGTGALGLAINDYGLSAADQAVLYGWFKTLCRYCGEASFQHVKNHCLFSPTTYDNHQTPRVLNEGRKYLILQLRSPDGKTVYHERRFASVDAMVDFFHTLSGGDSRREPPQEAR